MLKLLLLIGLVAACSKHRQDSQPQHDVLVDQFRDTERACISAFNNALARQRSNEIDEVGLASAIEKDVLPPWQEMHAKVNASPKQDALYTTLRHYLEAREIAWQAYAAGLRAGSEDAARPHLDTYHSKDAEADGYARELGRMFRDLP